MTKSATKGFVKPAAKPVTEVTQETTAKGTKPTGPKADKAALK